MLDIPTEIFVDDLRRIKQWIANGEVGPEDIVQVKDHLWGTGRTYAERAACLQSWIDEESQHDREYAEQLRRWIERTPPASPCTLYAEFIGA